MLSTAQLPTLLQIVETKKPWVVIGAGPVGSMMAAMIITLFPEQEVHVFDKYYTNVRGHGLDIHAATIQEMINILEEAKNQTLMILVNKTLSAQKEKYYTTIVKRIHSLKEHLVKEVSGQFIRTFKISEIMQKYCHKVGKGLVQFHLKSEITAEDLNILNDHSIIPSNEKQDILTNAEIIFGADGSHSGVRKTVFNETSDEVRKDVLTHLRESKLEMNEKPNKFFDKLYRSVLPTIKSGQLHIWNQSIDGTATLHVFINKSTYDQLHVQDSNGTYKGTFANPYRRLIDLPQALQDEIEKIVVDIIDENKIHASTLKVTAIPMHVYKARQLIKMTGNKRIILVGDSGIGLVLARSANNGFYATADYAASLYHEQLEKEFGQYSIPGFANYQDFWEDQHSKIDILLNYIDKKYPISDDTSAIANRQIKILDDYERQYENILKLNLYNSNYVDQVNKIQNDFYFFICNMSSYHDKEIRTLITDLFRNLKDPDYLLKHPITSLHACQNRLIKRANNKIGEAKFEVALLNAVKKVYDTSYNISYKSSSLSFSSPTYFKLDDDELQEIKLRLNFLRDVVSQYDLNKNPEYEAFVFLVDRMYLAIERAVQKISIERMIPYYVNRLNATIKYLIDLPKLGTEATKLFLQEPLFVDENLLQQVTETGNYLFNQVRCIKNIDDETLFLAALHYIKNYSQNRTNNDVTAYEYFFGMYNKEEAAAYTSLLSQTKNATVKFVLLYALFRNTELTYLKESIFKGIFQTKNNPTELDIRVLCEELQSKIMSSAKTKQIEAFDDIANDLLQICDQQHTKIAMFKLTSMLSQLKSLQKDMDDQSIIITAIKHLNSTDQNELIDADDYDTHTLHSSSVSSFFATSAASLSRSSTSSLFKAAQKISSTCMEALTNIRHDSAIKLSIIYALLTNKENPDLQISLSSALGKNLQPGQVAEAIESRLTLQFMPEHLSEFSTAIYKLTAAINNGHSMKKELKLLDQIFSSMQYTNDYHGSHSFANLK